MKTSEQGIAFIAAREGEILHVYDDGFKYPTAGVGHLLTADELKQYPLGSPITKDQSRTWLAADLADAEKAVNSAVTAKLNQNQFDACVSLCFNIGARGFKGSSVVRKINAGDTQGAADAFLLWNKVKGGVVKGLTTRRNLERKLFLTTPPDTQTPADNPVLPTNEPPIDPTAPASVQLTAVSAVTAEIPKGDAPDAAPVKVSTGGPLARWLFAGGGLMGLGTAVWGFVQSNLNAVGIGIICVTVLILAIIFRGAITDAIRMQSAADPDKRNVK